MEDEKNKSSISDKIKEGVSVHELETFARKYTTESFIILAIIIATISSSFGFFVGAGWSLVFIGIGSIVSIAFPEKIIKFEKLYFKFVTKQEKASQITIGVVKIVLALFLPFIIFGQLGLLAGISFHHFSHKFNLCEKNEEKDKNHTNDNEHI